MLSFALILCPIAAVPRAEPGLVVGEPIPVPVLKGVLERPGGALLGTRRDGKTLVVLVSRDGAKTWKPMGVAARSERPDLGDGNLVALRDGSLALTYRDNARPEFAVRVVRSHDGGQSWGSPETIAENDRGLWAPFLLPMRDGSLLCFYDDEGEPARKGRPGHQWIAVRRFALGGKAWGSVAVASRRPDSASKPLLARDGMMAAIEVRPNRILGVVEDVASEEPKPSGIYFNVSGDGGRTWGWSQGRRPTLFRPEWPHMAVAPALCRLSNGPLLCAFATDEGRETTSRSGTPPHEMRLETWGALSADGGETWGAAFPIHRGTARDYLAALTPRRGGAWLNVLDFDRGPLLIPLSATPIGARR